MPRVLTLRRLALPFVAATILLLLILTFANAQTINPPFKLPKPIPMPCPFGVSPPIMDRSGSQVRLTFSFGTNPPRVSTWDDNANGYGIFCYDNECDISVEVTGPQGDCKVLMVAHHDIHTYTLPPGYEHVGNVCIYVNGNEDPILCVDPETLPSGEAVGGTVLSANTAQLLAPWILLSSVVAVPALAIYFAKRR